MTKKHLAYLLATTLLAAPVHAQTSGTSGSGSTSPSKPGTTEMLRGGSAAGMNTGSSSTGSSNSGSSMSSGASGRGSMTTGQSSTSQPATGSSATRSSMSSADVNRALAAPGDNQMMSSDIRGTRVYGANNENVGDINDILLAQDGQIVALVVGVGGFLGIGQKDVAIPYKAFEFVAEGQTANRTSTSTSTGAAPSATTASPNATGSGSSMSGVSGTTSGGAANPTTTGSTPSATSRRMSTTGVMKPERIVLRGMTKADLEAAPQFRKTAAADDRSTPARTGTNR